MKLHLADNQNRHAIAGYGPGYLVISGIRYEQPLIVSPAQPPLPWAVTSFEDLDAGQTAALLENAPEIIVLGTGATQRFAAPAIIRPLIEAGIGLEMMNTPAACRTYNILMGEGRNVIAVLFPP